MNTTIIGQLTIKRAQKILSTLSIVAILFSGTFSLTRQAHASETEGTIDTSNKVTRVCRDVTCTEYNSINFAPTININTPGAPPVTITDTAITGHAWGDYLGWINMTPSGLTGAEVLTVDPDTGELSGFAYANVGSWINFSPTTVSGGTEVGVTITEDGEFDGWAWVSGVYGGWLKFDCSAPATCVKTDWRPESAREDGGSPSGSRGSGAAGTSGGNTDISLLTAFNVPMGWTTPDGDIVGSDSEVEAPQRLQYTLLYRADVDDDKFVEIDDFNLMMVNWAKKDGNKTVQICSDRNIADLNCDTDVNMFDYNIIMIYWYKYVTKLGIQ